MGAVRVRATTLRSCCFSRLPARISQRRHVVQAEDKDAARKILQDVFKGKKDVLSENEPPKDVGDGGSSGDGGQGGGGWKWNFSVADWWDDFKRSTESWRKFFAGLFTLWALAHAWELFMDVWEEIPYWLRLEERVYEQPENMERGEVDEDEDLGEDERDIMEKYGAGTEDVTEAEEAMA